MRTESDWLTEVRDRDTSHSHAVLPLFALRRPKLYSISQILLQEDWPLPRTAADVDKVLSSELLLQRLSAEQVSELRSCRRHLEHRERTEVGHIHRVNESV